MYIYIFIQYVNRYIYIQVKGYCNMHINKSRGKGSQRTVQWNGIANLPVCVKPEGRMWLSCFAAQSSFHRELVQVRENCANCTVSKICKRGRVRSLYTATVTDRIFQSFCEGKWRKKNEALVELGTHDQCLSQSSAQVCTGLKFLDAILWCNRMAVSCGLCVVPVYSFCAVSAWRTLAFGMPRSCTEFSVKLKTPTSQMDRTNETEPIWSQSGANPTSTDAHSVPVVPIEISSSEVNLFSCLVGTGFACRMTSPLSEKSKCNASRFASICWAYRDNDLSML